MMAKSNRRAFLKTAPAVAAAAAVTAPVAARAQAPAEKPTKKVHYPNGKPPDKPGLFNNAVSYGNLVFISGIGAHFEGDIKAHTKHVLDELKKSLERAGLLDGEGAQGERVPERPEGL